MRMESGLGGNPQNGKPDSNLLCGGLALQCLFPKKGFLGSHLRFLLIYEPLILIGMAKQTLDLNAKLAPLAVS